MSFGQSKYENGWWHSMAPSNVTNFAAAASGTFQCADARLGSRHRFTADVDVFILGGTGASVSASGAGLFLKAGVPYDWFPTEGVESLGWATTDGDNAAYASVAAVSIRARS